MSSSCPGSPDNHSAWHEDPHVRDGIHVLFGELRLLIDGRGDGDAGVLEGGHQREVLLVVKDVVSEPDRHPCGEQLEGVETSLEDLDAAAAPAPAAMLVVDL